MRYKLSALNVSEPLLDCENCSAIAYGFNKNTKCCTYFPELPNFAIGRILRSAESMNAEVLETLQKLVRSDQASPLGIKPTAQYREKFRVQNGASFGRDQDLLCPMFDRKSGKCGIWENRPSPCGSYFCSSRYTNGLAFWEKSEKLLTLIEVNLALEVLYQMGWTNLDNIRSNPPWFEWENRRSEFYSKAAEIFDSISVEEVWDLMGEEGKQSLWEIEQMAQKLVPEVSAGKA